MKKHIIIICIIFLIVSPVLAGEKAQLKLPAIFGDNMVLQQKSQAPVWGWAKPGSKITIKCSWKKDKIKTRADESGAWQVRLQTPGAGGPYSIKVKNDTTIVFKNVKIGEVWLCSGQSNMSMPVDSVTRSFAGVPNYQMELATVNYSNIRLFHFPRTAAAKPQSEVFGFWEQCDSTTLANFSAAAYFFGKELHERLNVPIGLIHSSWGGSSAEAWTKAEKLLQFPEFKTIVEELDSLAENKGKLQREYEIARAEWDKLARDRQADDLSNFNQWIEADFIDTAWSKIEVPHKWSKTALSGFNGSVWFRKIVYIPENWQDKNLILHLGPIDEMDITWFNGEKIGEHTQVSDYTKERIYTIPSKYIVAGRNSIILQVANHYGEGGIYGQAERIKICPEDSSLDNEISLSGEWRYKICLDYKTLPPIPRHPLGSKHRTPTLLYNAMIHPLIPFSIKGVIWYQGESNTYDADLYSRLFPAMINNWREDWNQGEFPFYYVQIAPYKYGGEYPVAAELREAQRSTLSVPNTGMVVITDLGNVYDIHPRRKVEVGKRLALWALAKDYDVQDVVYSGPLYRESKIEDNKIRLWFDCVGSGLYCLGDKLTHFTIAGDDSVFVPANAVIDGNTIVVSSDQVVNPIAVRFGWSNTAQPNLFNIEGLPASPFKTDEWNRVKK